MMEHLNEDAIRYLCGNESGMVSLLALSTLAVAAIVIAVWLGFF